MKDKIQDIVKQHAGLDSDIGHSTDLYQAGMTSFASVTLMVALENEFGLEFPDSMLNRGVFRSVDSITSAIESLQQVA